MKHLLIFLFLLAGFVSGCREPNIYYWKLTTPDERVFYVASSGFDGKFAPHPGSSVYTIYHKDGSFTYLSEFTVIEITKEEFEGNN